MLTAFRPDFHSMLNWSGFGEFEWKSLKKSEPISKLQWKETLTYSRLENQFDPWIERSLVGRAIIIDRRIFFRFLFNGKIIFAKCALFIEIVGSVCVDVEQVA